MADATTQPWGGQDAARGLGAVLFDLDGTLVRSEAAVEATWRTWADDHALEATAVLALVHGRRTEEVVAALLPAAVPGEEAMRIEADIIARGAVAVPELCALYEDLAPGRRAIVTSGRRATAQAHVRNLGLGPPAALVCAEDVPRGKPDPAPYLLALRRLGVPASRCLVFEDAPIGVRAGRAAGMAVVGVTTSHAADTLLAAGAEVALDPAAAAAHARLRLGGALTRGGPVGYE